MDGLNLQYLNSHSFFVNHYTQGEFWVLDEFLWRKYSNETSSVVLSHGTIYLLITPSVCEQYAMVWPFFSSIFIRYYLLLALLKSSLEILLKFDLNRFWDYCQTGFAFPGGSVVLVAFIHDVRERNAPLTIVRRSESEVHVPTPGYLINLSVISWLMTDRGSSTAKAR